MIHIGKLVTSRRMALRAGNRAGMVRGIMARGIGEMSTSRLGQLAHEAVSGQSAGSPPVPQRWREIYIRAFVKAVRFAAHTDHDITVSSKYGVA